MTKTHPQDTPPTCIGIIMDGNRRFARGQGLPTYKGHEAGAERLHDAVDWIQARGIKQAIFYTFSTENWSRDKDEVDRMMRLLESRLTKHFNEFIEKKIRVSFLGQRERFRASTQAEMERLEEATKDFTDTHAGFALSYGGRAELLDAFETLREKETSLTEADVSKALWSKDFADPDLIIRTGGQHRLSNFLPWQSVYSEIAFTDTLWPDFSENELQTLLDEYAAVERRKGM